ncbi:MAG: RsbRD N-terminal domain-containing protein [Pseudomonadota bacterium]
MSLVEMLQANRSGLIKKWIDEALGVYPSESASFLRGRKDPFQNPVGNSLSEALEELFDQLLAGLERDKAASLLDRCVRIRAVQDIPAGAAVGFIFSLKHFMREALAKEIKQDPKLLVDLFVIENQVDALALIAFDVYMKCREQIYSIKAEEVKRLYYQAIRHSDIFCVIPGQEEPDLKPPQPAEVISIDSKKESQT